MSEKEETERVETSLLWLEFKLPEVLMSEEVRMLHATIEREWSSIMRSACQTAAGRALWNHAVHDPAAAVLAGESHLHSLHEKIKKDQLNNAYEISGVIIAVRTLWFDSRLEAAINSSIDRGVQVVLLGAGMDARVYRLSCLKESNVYEVDFPELLQKKAALIKEVMSSTESHQIVMKAKSLIRVPASSPACNTSAKDHSCKLLSHHPSRRLLE